MKEKYLNQMINMLNKMMVIFQKPIISQKKIFLKLLKKKCKN